MLVFIDESGDPGFKVEKSSSPIFVTSMVIFDSSEHAHAAHLKISQLRSKLGVKPEFKFNKCRSNFRDAFFEELYQCNFRTSYVVVKKDIIYRPALRNVKDSFYKFFIRSMIEHYGGALKDAKIIIDGSGDRTFKRTFCSYLKKSLRKGCASSIVLKDSVKDPLVQLADMSAGAIARSYRTDRADSNRWRSALHRQEKIENVWDFR